MPGGIQTFDRCKEAEPPVNIPASLLIVGIARQGISVRRISSRSTRPMAYGPRPTLGNSLSESGGIENSNR